MRDPHDVCHVAVPVRDLDEAVEFYQHGLGCHQARRHGDRVTFDFFGDQLVCHLAPEHVVEEPTLYPRHFGVTFRRADDLATVLRLVELRKLPVFAGPSTRFEGTAEEHRTVVLRDPSGNLIEFKHYVDARMMY
jgi:extradiol dioxygenase family protein